MIHEPELTDKQKQKITETYRYLRSGGSISCGHDFWEKLDKVEFGDTVLCTRCYQYFVKMKDLVWWIDGNTSDDAWDFQKIPHSNHLSDKKCWIQPVEIRFQNHHGHTIKSS